MYVVHALCVLGRQGSGRRHGIATVSGNDLLVCLQAAGQKSALSIESLHAVEITTNAPPELSEPAITRIRPATIVYRIARPSLHVEMGNRVPDIARAGFLGIWAIPFLWHHVIAECRTE